jgi:S-adenosylmethionine/arginine decarboxylase-like enzyme
MRVRCQHRPNSEDIVMKNIHFIGEWFECRASRTTLSSPQAIHARCMEQLARRHLPIRYQHFTPTESGGVIGSMTGRDIHIVLRTFPDQDMVKADLFVYQGDHSEISAAMQVFDNLRDEFRPMRALLHRAQRDGQPLPARGRTPRAPTEVFLSKPVRRAG